MRLLLIAALAITGTMAACTAGYWGADCNSVCGMCKGGVACAEADGKCPAAGCADGWGGPNCDKAECFQKSGGQCSEGGKCVAPNYCVCGEQGAQIVGKSVERAGEKGTDCVSLRKDGIKGAGIAMVVMFVSIGFCGGVERMRNKAK